MYYERREFQLDAIWIGVFINQATKNWIHMHLHMYLCLEQTYVGSITKGQLKITVSIIVIVATTGQLQLLLCDIQLQLHVQLHAITI